MVSHIVFTHLTLTFRLDGEEVVVAKGTWRQLEPGPARELVTKWLQWAAGGVTDLAFWQWLDARGFNG